MGTRFDARRPIGWFAAGVAATLLSTVAVTQAWTANASPGDTDSTYVAITPCRLADTRPDPNRVGPTATLTADSTATIAAAGANGECSIPSDAVGLAMNVTAIGATASGNFLTFWPNGERPLAASLNPSPGQPPTPNAVTTLLSDDGSFEVYNFVGSVDIVIDVIGYYTQTSLLELQQVIDDVADLKAQTLEIPDGSIVTVKLADGSVTSAKIVDDSITSADLAADSVGAAEIVDDSITGAELADDSVGAAEIADDSIETDHLAADAVTTAEVLNNSLTSSDLAVNAVGTDELQTNSVQAAEIDAGAVGASEIATGAVGASEIATNAVGASEVADGSLRMADLAMTSHTDSINLFGTVNNGTCTSSIAQAATGAVANNLTVIHAVHGSGSDGWTIEGLVSASADQGSFRICNNTGANASPPNLEYSFLTIGL